jgi:hypothetical protein
MSQEARQASAYVTEAQAEAAAWRLWELVGDEEQKLSINDCRHLIAEALSAAGLRMGAGECGGETALDRQPDSEGQKPLG